jgi:hypothetical protein
MKKRLFISALVLLTVFVSVFGFAATLGVSPNDLGAGNSAVGSCDTNGVSTSYANAWDATDKRYEVSSVTINGIADTCDGKNLKAALTDASNDLLGDGSVVVPTGVGTTATVSSLSASPAASAVENVHVVIGD